MVDGLFIAIQEHFKIGVRDFHLGATRHGVQLAAADSLGEICIAYSNNNIVFQHIKLHKNSAWGKGDGIGGGAVSEILARPAAILIETVCWLFNQLDIGERLAVVVIVAVFEDGGELRSTGNEFYALLYLQFCG